MNEGFVYKWHNTLNGKWYIGSHIGPVEDRYIGSGKAFLKSYNKNKDYFFRCIIYQGCYVRELEDFTLKELDAKNNRMSYNLCNDGCGFSSGKDNPNYGDGTKNPAYGRPSKKKGIKQSKEQILKTARGRTKGKIYCEYLGKVFESKKEVCDALGVSTSAVGYYLTGERTNKYGLKRI
mgnify:CR=1 FL=1